MSIEAMKLALEALDTLVPTRGPSIYKNAITALRQAIEQAEKAQPVAWGIIASNTGRLCTVELDADEVAEHNQKYVVPLYVSPPPRQPLTDERIESVRHMRDVQGYDGNWNCDPYMHGLYNGLEFALSLLEVRQPEFKDAPATWLGDIKFKRDKLSSEASHDIRSKT